MRPLPTAVPLALAAAALAALLGACRGGVSEQPPIHPVLDMDFQPSLEAQEEFEFFADRRASRGLVAGVRPVGYADSAAARMDVWKDAAGNFVASNPVPKTLENVQAGRELFDIHCAACHARDGSGESVVLRRAVGALAKPPHLATEQRLRDMADGNLYQTIRDGLNTMPAYGHQVGVEDRWRIVHYLRALQLSRRVDD